MASVKTERIQKLHQIACIFNQRLLKLEDYGMTMQESTEKGMPSAMTRDLLQNIVQTEEELTIISQALSTISKDWKSDIHVFEGPVEDVVRRAQETVERLERAGKRSREPANPTEKLESSGSNVAKRHGDAVPATANPSNGRPSIVSHSRYSSPPKRGKPSSSFQRSPPTSTTANGGRERGNGRMESQRREYDAGPRIAENRHQPSRGIYRQSNAPSSNHAAPVTSNRPAPNTNNSVAAGRPNIHPSRLGLVTFVDHGRPAESQSNPATHSSLTYYNASLDPRQQSLK